MSPTIPFRRKGTALSIAVVLLSILLFTAACNRSAVQEEVQEPPFATATPTPEASDDEDGVESSTDSTEESESDSESDEADSDDIESDGADTDATVGDSGGASDTASEDAVAEDAEAEEAESEEAEGDEAESDEASTADSEADEADVETEVEPAVFFLQPTDNAIVPLTSTVKMGVTGLTVQASGEINEDAGHMHILIDVPFIEPGEVVPSDENHLHFGDGSTEVEVGLLPGPHTLRLQFADGAHIALDGDQYRDEIVVRASEDAPTQSVRIVTPTTGATVPPEFPLIMAANGLVVEPSGEIRDGFGHMHVLVDTDFIEPGQVIPSDENHLHFGGGQLESMLTLTPGEHTIRLQMADGAHIALDGEQYRDEIVVQVADDAPAEQVMFVEPTDGASIPETSTVQWGASGLIIEPSGPVLRENGGHLHIIVDSDFVEPGQVIPSDETHIHFGGGQTETELTLAPGEHTLRLQMADGAHIAMEGDQYRDEIVVTVE